jgi:hypothetical protein
MHPHVALDLPTPNHLQNATHGVLSFLPTHHHLRTFIATRRVPSVPHALSFTVQLVLLCGIVIGIGLVVVTESSSFTLARGNRFREINGCNGGGEGRCKAWRFECQVQERLALKCVSVNLLNVSEHK